MANPLASVIIPNWNGKVHLPTCLNALRRQTITDFETIVVDNGSQDGSQDLIRSHYPDVRLLPLPTNRGYAGGCNAGFRAARGEILVVLNNDTEVTPHWLEALLDALERHPEAGMATSKVLLFDRRDTFHTTGQIIYVDGMPNSRGVWEADHGQYDEEAWVFGAEGVAAAYRRAMLDDIGLFEEAFGSFCEDVDLNWRAQLRGYRCIYTPDAVVYHKLSATGGGPIASYLVARNTLWVLMRNLPTPLWYKYRQAILHAQLRRFTDALRAWRGRAARATCRGWLIGLITLPRWIPARRIIQRTRRVPLATLESRLTPL